MVVLDTCVLLWWTLDPARLSARAARECKRIEQSGCVISSISIWEVGIKLERRRLEIGLSLEDYVARLRATGLVEIAPVTELIWMRNLALDWDHRDPADRTIVATALERRLSIVTPDPEIRSFYRRTLW